MLYVLYVVVGISFKRPSLKVYESVGCVPVQLKSRGLYSRPLRVSFTCVEVAPVEAEGGYAVVDCKSK